MSAHGPARAGRWRRAAIAALLVASIAPAACSPAPSREETRRTTPAPWSVAPTPTAAASGDEHEGFAVWPEDTLQAAEASLGRLESGADPWRADPAETALRFVERVLGWTEAVAGAPIDRGDGLVAFDVRSGSGAENVEVLVACLVDPWWWVYSVHGGLGRDPVVSVMGSLVHVGVDVAGAMRTDIEVGYGDREVQDSLEGSGELSLRLGFRPATTGRLLVLARDASGHVIGAFASPLPAGDFAAG